MHVSQINLLASSFLSNDISNMNAQLKWELREYEIRKFTINYTKRKKEENNKHI